MQEFHKPHKGGLELNFDEVLALLRRHVQLIAMSLAACLALATAYLILTPAQYTATALLLIDVRSNILPSQQVRAMDANAESAHVETQVEVLRSEHIARAVIVAAGLGAYAEFGGSRPVPWNGAATPAKSPDNAIAEVPSLAVKNFHERLKVKRSSQTHIIEINFTYSDPKLAAKIANTVASSYLTEQLLQRDEIIRKTSQWLRQRAVELLSEAHSAETALMKFRSTNSKGDDASRIMLRDLETTAQTYRWFSENFQKRFLEMSQGGTFNVADARVVSEASPPLEKSHPKSILTLAMASAAGLAIGFLIALALGPNHVGVQLPDLRLRLPGWPTLARVRSRNGAPAPRADA